MKKVLVTGATGNLATELIKQLSPADYRVIALSGRDLDVSDIKKFSSEVSASRPDIIFHFAAKTDVDWCETHVQESRVVNVDSVAKAVRLAKEYNSILVFPSTYYVYEGINKNIIDDRNDSPIFNKIHSVYSQQKYAAERIIATSAHAKYFIVRLGSLFGGSKSDKKFVGKILRLAATEKKIPVVCDRFIQPSYTKDTVHALLKLVTTHHYGIYNLVAHGLASYYDYAQAILKYAQLPHVALIPIKAADFPESAPRSQRLHVINGRLQDLGLDTMRDWRIALKEYIQDTVL